MAGVVGDFDGMGVVVNLQGGGQVQLLSGAQGAGIQGGQLDIGEPAAKA